ncbi:N-acetylmuramoyl-L-alanine amidase [Rosettibacter firmus]|uniref:N-acetylmuramoyl-L-alanine amidase n=1 Tax=Rosettibacter firmus TaxID=3111522 RepID=UPI00336BCBF3
MKFYKIIFLIFFSIIIEIYPQKILKISAEIDGKNFTLSCVTKNGNIFVSSSQLAKAISSNYYYNPETKKIEIKLPDYNLKITANSYFVVFTKKSDNSQLIYQLPVQTILINDDIYVPIVFLKDYLSDAINKKVEFNSKTKTLIIKSSDSNEKSNNNLDANNYSRFNKTRYDIYALSIEDKINGTLIRLKSNKKIILPRHSIHDNILYVFFTNTTINPELTKNVLPVGFVKQCNLVLTSSRSSQLEFNLNEGYSSIEIFQDENTNDIILTIHDKNFKERIKRSNDNVNKWQFDVVVIDPGHGGKDPGAISLNGTKEKDINLGIALKLGKLIEENLPSVRVVYTRKTDEFVELYKRGKIANSANGKLFISIHCNSTPQRNISSRGFEVYLLRPGRTKEAIAIAEFENSVIKYEDNPERYQQLTDENFILVTMAHSQYMRYSERFSDLLNQEWEKNVGIPSNGIKQAGFYVLVGASMPSVLIETGYLSNPKDEAYLKSFKGQLEIAKAILKALIKYKELYDKEMEVLSKSDSGE